MALTPTPANQFVTPAIVWRGPWSSSVTYMANETVTTGGNAYICLAGCTGQEPPNATYWTLIASTGGGGGTTHHAGLDDVSADQHHAKLHAAAHATGQPDALTAANVGAAAASHSHAESDVTGLGTDLSGKVGTGDSRLSDARTPTAHTTSHKSGGTDEVASATAGANVIPKAGAGGTLAIGFIPTGATSSTVAIGNDARLSDSRTPTTHGDAAHSALSYLTAERAAASTAPVTQAFGDVAAVGTGTTDARADHKHGMPAAPAAERAAASTTPAAIGTGAVGTGTTDARADHVHATGAGTPSTQAFGDAAATGTGPAAAMTDHKHAMMVSPVSRSTAVASVTGFAADTYLAGSGVTIAANQAIAGSQFSLVFDVTKTAAGIAAPVITVRFGTLGTTGDAAIMTFTFSAQTAVVDKGIIRIWLTFNSVGSGTAAVVQGVAWLQHQLAVTGLNTVQPVGQQMLTVASSGFNSTTQTRLGVSVNGGASAAWTVTLVQAEFTT